jgi:hypothetical protein
MLKSYASLEKKYLLQAKAKGKSRFVRREVLFSLLIWLVVLVGVPALGVHSFSTHRVLLTGLITFPVFLLGGYLTGCWKWRDLEKKYSKDNLHPRK